MPLPARPRANRARPSVAELVVVGHAGPVDPVLDVGRDHLGEEGPHLVAERPGLCLQVEVHQAALCPRSRRARPLADGRRVAHPRPGTSPAPAGSRAAVVLEHEAVAAVEVERVVGGLLGGLGGEPERHRRQLPALGALHDRRPTPPCGRGGGRRRWRWRRRRAGGRRPGRRRSARPKARRSTAYSQVIRWADAPCRPARLRSASASRRSPLERLDGGVTVAEADLGVAESDVGERRRGQVVDHLTLGVADRARGPAGRRRARDGVGDGPAGTRPATGPTIGRTASVTSRSPATAAARAAAPVTVESRPRGGPPPAPRSPAPGRPSRRAARRRGPGRGAPAPQPPSASGTPISTTPISRSVAHSTGSKPLGSTRVRCSIEACFASRSVNEPTRACCSSVRKRSIGASYQTSRYLRVVERLQCAHARCRHQLRATLRGRGRARPVAGPRRPAPPGHRLRALRFGHEGRVRHAGRHDHGPRARRRGGGGRLGGRGLVGRGSRRRAAGAAVRRVRPVPRRSGRALRIGPLRRAGRLPRRSSRAGSS